MLSNVMPAIAAFVDSSARHLFVRPLYRFPVLPVTHTHVRLVVLSESGEAVVSHNVDALTFRVPGT
jgi:hypothetical protein